MEVDPKYQTDPSTFASLYVPGSDGAQVPLAQLTHPWRAHAPMWVRHAQQFPTMTLSFDTKPGVSIGQAIDAIRAAQATLDIPDEVKTEFTGEAGEASASGTRQLLLFLGAVCAVYIVLGVLYESYAHPLTILSTLPAASFGALLALWLTHTEFTIMTAIACILVVGMVMKNAILVVDFALEAERADGLSPARRDPSGGAAAGAADHHDDAGRRSERGAAGGRAPAPAIELRQPLGIAIVGGLLVSQVLTLYTTPVVYVLIDRLRKKRRRPVGSVRDRLISSD